MLLEEHCPQPQREKDALRKWLEGEHLPGSGALVRTAHPEAVGDSEAA